MTKSSDSSSYHSKCPCPPVIPPECLCEKKCCNIPTVKGYTAEQLYCKYYNAVVTITAEYVLLGDGVTEVTESTPLAADSRSDIALQGNGFFTRDHVIVAPAHLVLMPPALSSVANRYPFKTPADLTLGTIKNEMVRASRILATVYDVNNGSESFSYELELLGVDGAGDIATLRICEMSQYNRYNPIVEACHPYFHFGKSRATRAGEQVYLLGNFGSNGTGRNLEAVTLVHGKVADSRFGDPNGRSVSEMVLVDAGVFGKSSGMPIFNTCGDVIGMQTTSLSELGASTTLDNFVAGPSEFFMSPVLKAFHYGKSKSRCGKCYGDHVTCVSDPVGSYWRYVKGALGFAYQVFDTVDYNSTIDFTSGAAFSGYPRLRFGDDGRFDTSVSVKEIIGVKVLTLAGDSDGGSGQDDGFWYVPGASNTAPIPDLVNSPLLDVLSSGDQVLSVRGYKLGNLSGQIVPALGLWRTVVGDRIQITYRTGGSADNASAPPSDQYSEVYCQEVCTNDFPALLDYPSYSGIFPNLSLDPYAFTFPVGQSVSGLPELNVTGAGQFHASV